MWGPKKEGAGAAGAAPAPIDELRDWTKTAPVLDAEAAYRGAVELTATSASALDLARAKVAEFERVGPAAALDAAEADVLRLTRETRWLGEEENRLRGDLELARQAARNDMRAKALRRLGNAQYETWLAAERLLARNKALMSIIEKVEEIGLPTGRRFDQVWPVIDDAMCRQWRANAAWLPFADAEKAPIGEQAAD